MLVLLEEHLPIAREEWDHVLRIHAERYPKCDRSVDTLKRKLSFLHRTKVPTGNPTMYPDVKRAKKVFYGMTERANIEEKEELDDAKGILDLWY